MKFLERHFIGILIGSGSFLLIGLLSKIWEVATYQIVEACLKGGTQ